MGGEAEDGCRRDRGEVYSGIVIQAGGFEAGAEMMIDVLEHGDVLEGKSVTIQAFSDVAHFLASDKSNAVIAN